MPVEVAVATRTLETSTPAERSSSSCSAPAASSPTTAHSRTLAPAYAAAIDEDVDVVLAQTEPGVPPVEAAAERARRCSARLVVNAAPVEGLGAHLLRQADPLVVNEHEAVDLLREQGLDVDVPPEGLARALREQLGSPSVVVSLGAEGACVVDEENDELVASPAVEAVDTTGAGDVLVGVIAARLAQGWGIVPATKDACTIAARAVTTRGARGYLGARR